jgi:hypothetical protein
MQCSSFCFVSGVRFLNFTVRRGRLDFRLRFSNPVCQSSDVVEEDGSRATNGRSERRKAQAFFVLLRSTRSTTCIM